MKKVNYYKLFLIYKWVIKLPHHYENKKEVLREQAIDRYKELSNEEKDIKKEYGRNIYWDTSEENKQRLKEYQKKLS